MINEIEIDVIIDNEINIEIIDKNNKITNYDLYSTLDLINTIKVLDYHNNIIKINIVNYDDDINTKNIINLFDIDTEKINY